MSLAFQFLLRLKQYEEEAAKHRQELSERVSRQVAEVLEKKLAGEYKLRGPPREDVTLRGELANHHSS